MIGQLRNELFRLSDGLMTLEAFRQNYGLGDLELLDAYDIFIKDLYDIKANMERIIDEI